MPGTPNGMRAIITIGEQNGIKLAHVASGPDGFVIALIIIIIETIIGIVTGNDKLCALCGSSLDALPIAANKAA